MELLCITRQVHCKAIEQTATLIHGQYNRDWGTSYSRPPIDPYLTPPCYKILAAPLDKEKVHWPVDVRVQGTRRAPETAERDWQRLSVDAAVGTKLVGD